MSKPFRKLSGREGRARKKAVTRGELENPSIRSVLLRRVEKKGGTPGESQLIKKKRNGQERHESPTSGVSQKNWKGGEGKERLEYKRGTLPTMSRPKGR